MPEDEVKRIKSNFSQIVSGKEPIVDFIKWNLKKDGSRVCLQTNGVPILDAIHVTRETAGNEVFAKMLGNVHNSIRQGDTFAAPLRQSKTVDGLICNMVSVGEETGDLDKMLLKIADNYDEQVDVMVTSLMSLLEPIMILVLGGVVMVIVLAIFLPMIQLISGLGSM